MKSVGGHSYITLGVGLGTGVVGTEALRSSVGASSLDEDELPLSSSLSVLSDASDSAMSDPRAEVSIAWPGGESGPLEDAVGEVTLVREGLPIF